MSNLTPDEQVDVALKHKEDGNGFFKEGNYQKVRQPADLGLNGHSAAGPGPHLRIPLGVNVQVSGRSGFRCVPTSFHRLVKRAARPRIAENIWRIYKSVSRL